MKPFNSLTQAELIALTEEQVKHYVDLACAEQGIPLLPDSAPVEPKPSHAPDMVVYLVGGVHFQRAQDAQDVADCIAAFNRFSLQYQGYRWSLPQYAQVDLTPVTVTEVKTYSETEINRVQASIEQFAKDKARYDEDRTAYNKVVEQRKTVIDEIQKEIEQAYSDKRKHDRMVADYNRYLELANGDRKIALRFLDNANIRAQEIAPELYPGEQAF